MKNIYDRIEENRKTGQIEFFIEERRDDCVISNMPVKEGILNPFGTVHPGAMLWLVEIGPDGKGFPLAINLSTSLLGNQRKGQIKAEARFVRNGKRVKVVRTRVTGDAGRLLADVTTTHIPAT